ncbi:MAG: sugar phosphate isomerase/epimerase [Planctomycetes bacterium]|nr:sugar phosphate isomerase/epimerase [Planctomycetota bacterium]MCP4839928.1 sugar phosphate isomerase/epimerase [Planctomycetota bacterium]
MIDRRSVIQAGLVAATAPLLGFDTLPHDEEHQPMSDHHWPISLAQWSLHRTLRAGELAAEDFPAFTREQFGISGVEYVNSFFKERSTDDTWLAALRKRCEDSEVTSLLIMVDGEGALGDSSEKGRSEAVANHRRWLHAAEALGCHGIRVNVPSEGTPEEQLDRCALGLADLLVHADAAKLNVMIENHGGLSSNGAWLASLIRKVDHPRLGTLPDFGNFILDWDTREMYDRYLGLDELLPFAKALSAKSHDFDEQGNEVHTDYERVFSLVRKHKYQGWVGVEYEGDSISEGDGIKKTRDLLIRQGCVLSSEGKSS